MKPAVAAPAQPRLSIAIPTYNRVQYLGDLLHAIIIQLPDVPLGAIELIVSDNCSTDSTPEMIAGLQAAGVPLRFHQNEVNLGPDGNILQCWNLATGEYVWVLGDDDLIVPGALPDLLSLLDGGTFDLVFVAAFSFSGEYKRGETPPGETEDRFRRYAEVVTDPVYFLGRVNALIALLSGNITNKNRLAAVPHPPLESGLSTNLVQLGWQFPLIRRGMSVLYIWRRLVAYRTFNSAGWGAARVFGLNLDRVAETYFAADPALRRALMNSVLRYWMSDVVISVRRGQHAQLKEESFAHVMRDAFRGNWRFWVFIYPLATLPLPFALALHRGLSAFNKLARAGQLLAHHWFHHGTYVVPAPRPIAPR